MYICIFVVEVTTSGVHWAHLSEGRREAQSMRKVEALLVSRQPKKDCMGIRR